MWEVLLFHVQDSQCALHLKPLRTIEFLLAHSGAKTSIILLQGSDHVCAACRWPVILKIEEPVCKREMMDGKQRVRLAKLPRGRCMFSCDV